MKKLEARISDNKYMTIEKFIEMIKHFFNNRPRNLEDQKFEM